MAIADTIQSMYDNVSNAYNVLEVAGADLTNVNKNILNLKTTWQERLLYFINNGTDVVWNNWDKVTGEGTTLTLNNIEEAPMKIDLKGNTSQATTTGKNLLINIRDEGYTVTSNGITFKVNADKSITVTGTATNIASMSLNNSTPVTLTAGTYTLSKKENSNVQVAIWYDSNSVFAAVQGTANTNQKTISQDTTYNKWRTLIVVYQGVTVNTTVYPMLEKSSTETSYEPYTNGASPNPDYPQDIHVVSGDNSINVVGKNLLSFTNITNNTAVGITRTVNQETITLNGTTTGAGNIVAKTSTGIILKAGTYTGSITTSGSYNRPNGDVAFYLRKDNTISGMFGKSLVYMTTNGQYSSTFTLTEDTEVFLEIYTNASNITFDNYVCKFQIEKGSTPSEYEKHIGNTYPINLPVENLFELPTTQTINGITFTNNGNGTFNLSGTASAITDFAISKELSTIANGKFTMSSKSTGYSLMLAFYNGNTWLSTPINKVPTELIKTGNITIPSNATKYDLVIRVPSGYTVNLINETVQFEKGSKANSYTQFGTTPIELCKIGDYQDIIKKSTGKNLFDKDFHIINGSYINGSGGIASDSTLSYQDYFIEVEQNTEYTISSNVSTIYRIAKYDSSKNFINRPYNENASTSYTINTGNAKYIKMAGTLTTALDSLQIEKSSSATTYEPYIGNTYPINLKGNNLFKGTLYNGIINQGGTYISNAKRITNADSSTMKTFILKKGTYTLSIENIDACTIVIKNESGSVIQEFADSWKTLPYTFTTTNDGYFYFSAKKSIDSVLTPSDYKPMLNKGTTALPYEDNWEIELCKIGTYQDIIKKSTGKNLIPTQVDKWEQGSINVSGNVSSTTRIRTIDYYPIKNDTNYYISIQNTNYCYLNIYLYNSNKQYIEQYYTYDTSINGATSKVINIPSTFVQNVAYMRVIIRRIDNTSTITANEITTIRPMLNEGSTSLTYEPYGTGWYVKKEIGKFYSNSTTGWSYDNNHRYYRLIDNIVVPPNNDTVGQGFCNVRLVTANQTLQTSTTPGLAIHPLSRLYISESVYNNISTTPTILYYALATPIYTEITDSTLLSQLNALKKAISYDEQTNISQNNNDLPFIINATALKEMA